MYTGIVDRPRTAALHHDALAAPGPVFEGIDRPEA